jgi:hypothetical protein
MAWSSAIQDHPFDVFMLLLLGSILGYAVYSLASDKMIQKDFAGAYQGTVKVKKGL